jgi:hypothetical protein
MTSKLKGVRKLVFGALALLFLAGGYVFTLYKPVGLTTFPAYVTGVVSILSAVVFGNVGEHAASRGQEKAP